mmetsp:Transcript_18029/g.55469  ORF Transcript_18029/g.55469 Transcript_18029/m.55469 type:complete len:209 (+) Transcript_18029:135-761(+)
MLAGRQPRRRRERLAAEDHERLAARRRVLDREPSSRRQIEDLEPGYRRHRLHHDQRHVGVRAHERLRVAAVRAAVRGAVAEAVREREVVVGRAGAFFAPAGQRCLQDRVREARGGFFERGPRVARVSRRPRLAAAAHRRPEALAHALLSFVAPAEHGQAALVRVDGPDAASLRLVGAREKFPPVRLHGRDVRLQLRAQLVDDDVRVLS